MGTTITIRMTPVRERLLKLFKKRYNLQKNSEAFELALKMGFENEMDYRLKIDKVAGCLAAEKDQTAVERIRSIRDR